MGVRWSAVALGFMMLLGSQNDGVLRLYLARHGETDWNREGRLQGSADIALNDTGRGQAARLADRLSGVRFDAVYSSELRRSRDTAEIVHGAAPLLALPGLNERRLGAFEGHPSSAEYEQRRQDPTDTLDGGESLSQFFARIQTVLGVLLQRHRSGAVLIVGHGATNQMIVRALFGLSAEKAAAFNQANDDLYLCEIASGTAIRFWKLTDPAR
jgi:2,3-bisphosphoglycerate-dependent phosphoglycerate mutase